MKIGYGTPDMGFWYSNYLAGDDGHNYFLISRISGPRSSGAFDVYLSLWA